MPIERSISKNKYTFHNLRTNMNRMTNVPWTVMKWNELMRCISVVDFFMCIVHFSRTWTSRAFFPFPNTVGTFSDFIWVHSKRRELASNKFHRQIFCVEWNLWMVFCVLVKFHFWSKEIFFELFGMRADIILWFFALTILYVTMDKSALFHAEIWQRNRFHPSFCSVSVHCFSNGFYVVRTWITHMKSLNLHKIWARRHNIPHDSTHHLL